jgi:hypothetical protein
VASLLPLYNFYSILVRPLEPEPSSSEVGETWPLNFTKHLFHARNVLLHAVNLRHATDDPPKEVVPRIFITLKNPSSSTGFEPANHGTSGKHATTRPPRATTDFLISNCKVKQKETHSTNTSICYICYIRLTSKRDNRIHSTRHTKARLIFQTIYYSLWLIASFCSYMIHHLRHPLLIDTNQITYSIIIHYILLNISYWIKIHFRTQSMCHE